MKLNLKKSLALLFSLAMLFGILAGCGQTPPAEETPDTPAQSEAIDPASLETVVFTDSVRGYHWAPAYLAESLGYLAEAGLKGDFQSITGADSSAPLFTGEAQFTLRGVETALMSNEAGRDMRIVYSSSAIFPFQLIGVNADYSTIASLEGKIVGGGKGAASSPQAFARAVLNAGGLVADETVSVIDMKSAAYLAAIKNNEIQAAVGTNPWATKMLLDNGGQMIVDGANPEQMKDLLGTETYELFMIATTESYIKSNPETVQKVVTAMAKAAAWMEQASPEDIAKALAPIFEGREEEITYSAEVDKKDGLTNYKGYHTDAGFAAAIKMTAQSGGIQNTDVSAESIYDESFLDNAWKALDAGK